jgi:methionine-rich copper-binding protein CopC
MKQRFWILSSIVLVAVLAACGGNTVSPQNNTGDTTAPTLTSSTPANTASSVAINSNIGFVFSEKMDTASLSVIADPNSDLGEPSWNIDANTLTFNPPANLELLSTYTLTLAGKDVAGNALASTSLQFTTSADDNPAPPADTTAPSIVSSSPENGATNAAINANIQVTFSEPINQGSIVATVTPTVGLGAPTFKSGNSIVEFNPPADLNGNTSYSMTISATDLAGNALTGTNSFSFKTATTADTTAPSTPQNLTAQASDTQIKFSWTANSEPDLKGYTLYYSNNANDLSSKVFISKPSTTTTLTGLTNGQTYYYQLEAEDGAGNRSGRTITKNATPKKPIPTDSIAPATPQNLTFEAGQSQIKFSWTANTEADLKRYTLYYGTNASAISTPVLIGKASTTHTLTGLTNGSIYFFQLEAEDTSGNRSGRTITKNATPQDFIPTLVSSIPADGAINVAASSVVEFKFSEPMDTSITAESTGTSCSAQPGTCPSRLSDGWKDDRTYQFIYAKPTGLGSNGKWEISFSGVRDKTGNLAPPVRIKFMVAGP